MSEKNDRDKDIDALMSDEKEEVSKDFKEDPSLSKYPSWLKEKYTKLIREKAIKAVKDQMMSNRTKASDYSREEMEELVDHEVQKVKLKYGKGIIKVLLVSTGEFEENEKVYNLISKIYNILGNRELSKKVANSDLRSDAIISLKSELTGISQRGYEI